MFRLRLFQHLINRTVKHPTSVHNYAGLSNWHPIQSTSTPKIAKRRDKPDITSNLKYRPRESAAENPGETEQEFVVRLKDDPDTFGGPPIKEIVDEGDLREEKYFEQQPHPSRKLRTKQYADIIKNLIKQRKIKEALDVVEIRMIKEDRVKPENYIYNLLLGACGRVGYTKKAFMLYNEMKKRGLVVTGGTYTALFNACANSPWPEDGLTRAKHLRDTMIEKKYEPNDTNYNAMIKAFGRCGDVPTAFALVDEMLSKRFVIKDDTINFLLQACISDSNSGFRHALLVWRKLLDKKITPTLYTYNLMLKSIRDCGIGDIETMKDVLDRILGKQPTKLLDHDTKLLVEPDGVAQILAEAGECQVVTNKETNLVEDNYSPNLMAQVPRLGNILALAQVKKAEDRLLLVGGLKEILKSMEEFQCRPDVKTFTLLLDCLPANLAAEKELMNVMKKSLVKPDLDFFNMMIKKRSMRFDYENAKAILREMEQYHYRPNVLTYGILALGCKTKDEALELIQEMKYYSYTLNTEILGAMLHQACHHKNFRYVLEVMEIALREDVKPNRKFMECLQQFKKTCNKLAKEDNVLPSFEKGFKVFLMRYKAWLAEVQVDESENEHPWTQYRQTSETETKHYKDKSVKFEPRHISRFRVKTSIKKRR